MTSGSSTRSDEVDLERERRRVAISAIGLGAHVCMGAPLARRELYFGFKAVIERFESIRLTPDANSFDYEPSYFLRGLKELHIDFTPRA